MQMIWSVTWQASRIFQSQGQCKKGETIDEAKDDVDQNLERDDWVFYLLALVRTCAQVLIETYQWQEAVVSEYSRQQETSQTKQHDTKQQLIKIELPGIKTISKSVETLA